MKILGVVIFYENGKVHHARFDYQKEYDGGRVSNRSEYVHPNEIDIKIVELLQKMQLTNYQQLVGMGLVHYADYDKLSEDEKKYEETLKKVRKREDFDNSKLGSIVDSMDSLTARVQKKLRDKHIDVKKLIVLPVGIVIVMTGICHAVDNYFNHEEHLAKKAEKVISSIAANDNVNNSDIDLLLRCLDYSSDDEYKGLLSNMNLCNFIFNSYKTDIPDYQTVISRFKRFYGLNDVQQMNNYELSDFCVYGVNLIMGGDNYSSLYNGSWYIAEGINTNKGYDREKFITTIAKQYNVSKKRVERSAVPAESLSFRGLPPIIRYIMISQVEAAVRKCHFEFNGEEYPTWWVGLYSKYDHEKLLEEIVKQKVECAQEVYEMYSSDSKRSKK